MINRFFIFIFLACFILGNILLSCQGDKVSSAIEETVQEDKPIVYMGKEKIYLSSFHQYIEVNFADEELSLGDEVLSRFLDYFIEERLLLREARLNMVIVSNSELRRIARQMIDENSPFSGNLPKDIEWLESLKNSLVVKKFISQHIMKDINVQLKEIEDYYERHKEEFKVPEELKISQILVESKEEAQKVMAKLRRRGADFHQLAQEYSISPEASRGGDMGYFIKGQLPPEFEKVIFSLKEGQYSSIIPSGYGYHIFLLEERRASGQLSISEVRDFIRLRLFQKKSDARLKEYVAELKEKVPIKIYYKNLDFRYIKYSQKES